MKRAFPKERPFRKSLNHGMRWWLAAWEALQREAQPDRWRRSQNRFANENVFSDSSAEKSGKTTCKTEATNFPIWRQKYFSRIWDGRENISELRHTEIFRIRETRQKSGHCTARKPDWEYWKRCTVHSPHRIRKKCRTRPTAKESMDRLKSNVEYSVEYRWL